METARLYLYDIGKLVENLTGDFGGLSYEKFSENVEKTESAARRFVIMKERWDALPSEDQQALGSMEWALLTGRWDRGIGRHAGIDPKKLWETIVNKLPGINEKVQELLKRSG